MQFELTASPRKFLQMVLWLRLLAICGQSVTVLIAYRWLRLALPMPQITAVICTMAVIALATGLRLRSALPATQLEVAAQLLIDIIELTLLLYLAGGATNPFASLYLIPIALSAVGLAWGYTAFITLCCLGCYVWLINHFSMLSFMHVNAGAALNLHMVGMHFTFAISAILLAAALSMMAAEMRRRDHEMATLREDVMRQEHLSAIGVLAAGAAHELSTPLFSMAMLVSELRNARQIDQQFEDDLNLLNRQIEVCKDKLTTLLQSAGRPRSPEKRTVPAKGLLQRAIDDWSVTRPAVRLEVNWQALAAGAQVTVDEGFAQSLSNLLDNAADASALHGSDCVRVLVSANAQRLQIAIDDDGPGLDSELQERAGKAVFSTKPQGLGLGLVLSHANLSRLNGDVTLTRRTEGGTRTTIGLPLQTGEGLA